MLLQPSLPKPITLHFGMPYKVNDSIKLLNSFSAVALPGFFESYTLYRSQNLLSIFPDLLSKTYENNQNTK